MTIAQLPLYEVRRSARARRARLTVTSAGDALVVLPDRAPAMLAADLVARHAGWLERHQRRIRAERRALSSRPPLGAGRSLPLRGVAHTLVVDRSAAGRPSVSVLAGPSPSVVVRLAAGAAVASELESESLGPLLDRWLRSQARREIGTLVSRRAAEMGVSPAAVSIRDQRTRWGSASRDGRLSFSWRLILCPGAVLDYVVVHELAHLRWRGHGPRFWALVARFVPDAAEHRRWLRANHRALRAALD